MESEKNQNNILSIYQTAILGAEEILRKIGAVPWNEKILLKDDTFLGNDKYQKMLLDRMEFFVPGEELADILKNLQELFLPLPEEQGTEEKQESEEMQIFFCKKGRRGNPTKVYLEICKEPYRIPFELHLISYMGHEIFPQKKMGASAGTGENFTYNMLPPEEYLTLAFYEIIKELELIKDLSWYKEVYEVLCKEPVQGRKVWESLNRLIKEYPIPSLDKRLETLVSYKNYGYMQKRWKNQSKRKKETYPQWEETITLIGAFLTPVFEGVVKDELFLGDWMPELGRYLD